MAGAEKVKGGGEPDSGHEGAMLVTFRGKVLRLWCRTLRRGSNRHRVTWARMYRAAGRWLANPHILHPYPAERLCVVIRGRSPVR
jgi:RNA-directed DNA polymerase